MLQYLLWFKIGSFNEIQKGFERTRKELKRRQVRKEKCSKRDLKQIEDVLKRALSIQKLLGNNIERILKDFTERLKKFEISSKRFWK